mmetsp:Transcript_73421/g.170319  ORF Transcript_73421/g.170319 Transcript_73421/m.170319 type:complete len:373 (-) Transcript_73421:37-1155(-)
MGVDRPNGEHDDLAMPDPAERLVCELRLMVAHFVDPRQMIRNSMEQDKDNTRVLRELEQRLCEQRDYLAVSRVTSRVAKIHEHSWSLVIPMRQNIKYIGDTLLELQGPVVLSNTSAVRAIVREIHEAAGKVAKVAASRREEFCDLAAELAKVRCSCTERRDDLERTARALKGGSSRRHGLASLPPFACFAGFLAAVATSAHLLSFVVGASAGAVTMLSTVVLAYRALMNERARREAWLEEARKAEQDIRSNQALIQKSRDAEHLTFFMVEDACFHERMWSGIGTAAQGVVDSPLFFESAQGLRGDALDKLRQCGEQLLQFVCVTDEYLFCLSKTQCFPPNFDVRAVIGSDAYKRLQREADRMPTQSVVLCLG